MATGNQIVQRTVDLMPEIGDNTGTPSTAETDRLIRHANAEREKIEGDIASLGEDYELVSATFVTTPGVSPNRYSLPDDFKDIRYLERIIDDQQGRYLRIDPMTHLLDKASNDQNQFMYYPGTGGTPNAPQMYYVGGDFIQLFPISDDVYDMRLWYTFKYPVIAATDIELGIPDELIDTLVWGICVREKMFRRDDAMPFVVEREATRARGLDNLQVRTDDVPHTIAYVGEPGEYV